MAPAPDPFINSRFLNQATNLPLKHARNLIGRPSFGQSHIDHMSSTSTPVKKACDNVFDLTNLSIQVRKDSLQKQLCYILPPRALLLNGFGADHRLKGKH